jgi:hypothetical protein
MTHDERTAIVDTMRAWLAAEQSVRAAIEPFVKTDLVLTEKRLNELSDGFRILDMAKAAYADAVEAAGFPRPNFG